MRTYNCGVLNCGGGQCVHRALEYNCPHCGAIMVEVTTTGHRFCASAGCNCEYEERVTETRGARQTGYRN